MEVNNYYTTLGVPRNASQEDIKRAYRKLAMQYHPDMGGSTRKFQEINEAHGVLADAEARDAYDRWCNTMREQRYTPRPRAARPRPTPQKTSAFGLQDRLFLLGVAVMYTSLFLLFTWQLIVAHPLEIILFLCCGLTTCVACIKLTKKVSAGFRH